MVWKQELCDGVRQLSKKMMKYALSYKLARAGSKEFCISFESWIEDKKKFPQALDGI